MPSKPNPLGNLSGDVRDWRVEREDALREVFVRVGIQSDGAYSGGDVEQGGLGGTWDWQDFDLRSQAGEYDQLIAALDAECPKLSAEERALLPAVEG